MLCVTSLPRSANKYFELYHVRSMTLMHHQKTVTELQLQTQSYHFCKYQFAFIPKNTTILVVASNPIPRHWHVRALCSSPKAMPLSTSTPRILHQFPLMLIPPALLISIKEWSTCLIFVFVILFDALERCSLLDSAVCD